MIQPSGIEPRALARRLRELRTQQFGRSVKQDQLGAALKCSVSLISSWESDRGTVMPSKEWLRLYARFFATKRSIKESPPRLLAPDELKPAEAAERDRLGHELVGLRTAELGASPSTVVPPSSPAPRAFDPWHFGTGEAIRIVCAELPEEMRERMPYTDPRDPDYIGLYRFSDLDSLLELYGYLRAVNPESPIEARLAPTMSASDYMQHVVLLGGVDWNDSTRYMLEQIQRAGPTRGMPVRQQGFDKDDPGAEVGFFVDDAAFPAQVVPDANSPSNTRLVQDVAHFFRGPNPLAANRTVTICNGMYGRGVLGAVLPLTRDCYRQCNAQFIRNRFGDSNVYSILTQVQILRGEVVTPDWTMDGTVLHEWPPPEVRSIRG
jgi:hypothetical protein